MNILLVNPPVWWYHGTHLQLNPSLGLPILGRVLQNAGHTATILDMEYYHTEPDALINSSNVNISDYDYVGITCLTSNRKAVRAVVDSIKGKTKIVIGGPHATIEPEEVLSYGADLVVTGECEGNIVGLLESDATGVVSGARMDIADIPTPLWERHFPAPNKYFGNLPYVASPEGIIQFTRGCPFSCIFCSNPIFQRQKIRYRPVTNILNEVSVLVNDYGIRSLFSYDDELIGTPFPKGWSENLCDGLHDVGVLWKSQGRCSEKYITSELMRRLYHGGCRAIMWGVESFSQKVLSKINKQITVADIWHTLKVSRDAGISNWVFTMIGNYSETEDDLAITAESLREAYSRGLIQWRQTTIATAMPHTKFERLQKDEGWYVSAPEDGKQMAQLYYDTPFLTADMMAKWAERFEYACPRGY